jgi:hydrogenase expression/formation protein HypC
MYLAIPMKIITIDGYSARCDARGVERDISLFMMQNDDAVEVGDFVMAHVGYTTRKMTRQEARPAWKLFDQVLGTEDLPLTTGDEYV